MVTITFGNKLKGMEINQLRYFYEAARCGQITKAANNMNIAQPALTKSIKSLEDELGVKLFNKVGRGVILSEYGEFLKEKVQPIINEFDALPFAIKSFTDLNENTVSINVLAASTVTTDIIIKFKKIYPNVLFKMVRKENEPNADIEIITNSMSYNSSVNVKKSALIEEKIYVAVPLTGSLAVKDEVLLEELKSSEFIALSGSRRFRPLCDAYCEYAGFKPRVTFESDSLIAVKNLIAAGVGVAFWPEFSWGEITHKNIKLLNIVKPNMKREIILQLKSRKNSDISRKFFDFLVEELKKNQKTT